MTIVPPSTPASAFRLSSRSATTLVALLAFAAGVGLVGGCTNVTSLNVPLQFRPTDALNTNAVAGRLPGQGAAKVYVAPVDDKRDEREVIGRNMEKANPVPVYPTGAAPAEFVRDVMQQDLRDVGVDLATDPTAATRTIAVELNKFFVTETDLYRGEVRALVKVSDPSGAVLWRGPLSGTSSRFGRSLNAENYQEAMSDALRQFTQGLFNNPGFLAALGGGSSPAGGTTLPRP